MLLDLDLAPIELDDLYVAQVLVSWPAYHGERTVHRRIRRLPPAHTLTVTAGRVEVQQYWFLERMPTLRLRDRREYQDCIYGPLLARNTARVFALQSSVCQTVRVWGIERPRSGWSEDVMEAILSG